MSTGKYCQFCRVEFTREGLKALISLHGVDICDPCSDTVTVSEMWGKIQSHNGDE